MLVHQRVHSTFRWNHTIKMQTLSCSGPLGPLGPGIATHLQGMTGQDRSGFVDVHSLSSKRATNAATCHSRQPWRRGKKQMRHMGIGHPLFEYPKSWLLTRSQFDRYLQQTWFRRWSHPYLQLLHIIFTVIWDFQKSFTNPSLFF